MSVIEQEAGSEKPTPITPEAIQELAARYHLHPTILRAWGAAFDNDLSRLEGYLKSQHCDRTFQNQPEGKEVPEQ